MFVARRAQHLQEHRAPRPHQRGVASCLVDYQHIAGRGRWAAVQMGVVLRQVQSPQPGNGLTCLGPQGARARAQRKSFDQRGGCGVEMAPDRVDQQSDGAAPGRPMTRATGQDRPQKGVLDRDKPRAAQPGDGATPPSARPAAPDADMSGRIRQTQAGAPAGKRQYARKPGLTPEACAVYAKPPRGPGGLIPIAGVRPSVIWRGSGHCRPSSAFRRWPRCACATEPWALRSHKRYRRRGCRNHAPGTGHWGWSGPAHRPSAARR